MKSSSRVFPPKLPEIKEEPNKFPVSSAIAEINAKVIDLRISVIGHTTKLADYKLSILQINQLEEDLEKLKADINNNKEIPQ